MQKLVPIRDAASSTGVGYATIRHLAFAGDISSVTVSDGSRGRPHYVVDVDDVRYYRKHGRRRPGLFVAVTIGADCYSIKTIDDWGRVRDMVDAYFRFTHQNRIDTPPSLPEIAFPPTASV